MRREQAPRMSHCPLLKQIKLFSNDKQLKVLLLMSNNQHDIPNLPRCGTTTKKHHCSIHTLNVCLKSNPPRDVTAAAEHSSHVDA